MVFSATIAIIISSVITLVLVRLSFIIPCMRPSSKSQICTSETFDEARASIMILLGSGGHTGEMVRLLSGVNLNKFARFWVVSSGDNTSISKAESYEKKLIMNSPQKPVYIVLHRARRVGEPVISSIFNTLKSFLFTFKRIIQLPELPRILILNGPGTSVPLAYILFFLKFLSICDTKIVYVESLARVSSLSLSGLLCLPISDRFIVQWEPLKRKYRRSEYYGILV